MASKLGRLDPTRTTTLRSRVAAEVNKRFIPLKGAITRLLVDEDAFGLAAPPLNTLVANQRWRFLSDTGKVDAFREWLQSQLNTKVLETEGLKAGDEFWMAPYINSAYKQGAVRAYLDSKPALATETQDYYAGTKDAFLGSLFGGGVATKQLERLYSRSFQDLKGVTAAMDTAMSRTLSDGLAHGKSPRDIAKDLNKNVDGIGIVRARTIARTEIIHSHAEGQLDAFEALGVQDLGVMAEWSTTQDDKVCPRCRPLQGAVFTVKEARGLLPRHPNCRCAWIPANVGEPEDELKAKRAKTAGLVDTSIQAEAPKGTLADAKAKTRWLGGDATPGHTKQWTKKGPGAKAAEAATQAAKAAAKAVKAPPPPPPVALDQLKAGDKARFTHEGKDAVIHVLDTNIGGSTGAKLVEIDGVKYVAKDYKGNQDQVANEWLANQLYAATNQTLVKVPTSRIFEMGGKRFIGNEYLEGGTILGNATGALKEAGEQALRQGFVTDAWLANWDVVGLSKDNVLLHGGNVYRIDNGGALLYRAQGGLKKLTGVVDELKTLKIAGVNPAAASVFKDVTDGSVVAQIAGLKDGLENAAKAKGQNVGQYLHGLAQEAGFKDPAKAAEAANLLEQRFGYLLKHQKATIDKIVADAAAKAKEPKSPFSPSAWGQPLPGHPATPAPTAAPKVPKAADPLEIAKKKVTAAKKAVTIAEKSGDFAKYQEAAAAHVQATLELKATKDAAKAAEEPVGLQPGAFVPLPPSGPVVQNLRNIKGTEPEYKKLTAAERAAVTRFTGTAYAAVNQAALGRGSSALAVEYAQDLQKALAKLPRYEGVTARGIKNVPDVAAKFENWKTGKWAKVEWKAFSSTTARDGKAFDHTDGVLFLVKGKGKQGAYVRPLSEYAHEEEVLFQAGSQFRVAGYAERPSPANKSRTERLLIIEEVDGKIPLRQEPPKAHTWDEALGLLQESAKRAYSAGG